MCAFGHSNGVVRRPGPWHTLRFVKVASQGLRLFADVVLTVRPCYVGAGFLSYRSPKRMNQFRVRVQRHRASMD
jgi:hypothetical protein